MVFYFTPVFATAMFYTIYHLPVLLTEINSHYVSIKVSRDAILLAYYIAAVYFSIYLIGRFINLRTRMRSPTLLNYDLITMLLLRFFAIGIVVVFLISSDSRFLLVDRVEYIRSSWAPDLFELLVPISSILALSSFVGRANIKPSAQLFDFIPLIFITVVGIRAPMVICIVAMIVYKFWFEKSISIISRKFLTVSLLLFGLLILTVSLRITQLSYMQEQMQTISDLVGLTFKFLLSGEIGQVSHNFVTGVEQNIECQSTYSILNAVTEQIPILAKLLETEGTDVRFSTCFNNHYKDTVSAKAGSNIFAEFYWSFPTFGIAFTVCFQLLIIYFSSAMIQLSNNQVQRASFLFCLAWFMFYYYRSNLTLSIGIIKLAISAWLLSLLITSIATKRLKNGAD